MSDNSWNEVGVSAIVGWWPGNEAIWLLFWRVCLNRLQLFGAGVDTH